MPEQSRFFEENADNEDPFDDLEQLAGEGEGGEEARDVSDAKKSDRERIMRKWHHFWNETYPSKQKGIRKRVVDSKGLWVDLCADDKDAKKNIEFFLMWYVKNSGRREICLGPEEYEWKNAVTSAVTLTEVWKNLVVEADNTVLREKRQKEPQFWRLWKLAFVERDKDGPVAEISRAIAGRLADKLGLTRKQLFVKREATPEDITLFIDTIWTQSHHLSMTSSTRLAFHTYLLITGLAGYRNGSVLNMPYRQVRFALVRDPSNPESPRVLVAYVLVYHNKRKEDRLQRNQDDTIEFAITCVPGPYYDLLTLLAGRALLDDAFKAGYKSFDEMLDLPYMDPGCYHIPLDFKEDILDKRIIPLTQEKLNEHWNRTLLVAGCRDHIKPYSMRVGTAGRLNGVLEPSLRNYVLSHSSGMFQHSYQPRHLAQDLAGIAFGKLGGGAGNARLYEVLRNSSLTRDDRAPLYATSEDLAEFNQRRDIQGLRKQLDETVDPKARDLISHKIRDKISSCSRLKVAERREAYFVAADLRRAQDLSADDLGETREPVHSPAGRVGRFMYSAEFKQEGKTPCSRAFGKLLLDYLQSRLSPLSEHFEPAKSLSNPTSAGTASRSAETPIPPSEDEKSMCILCRHTFANRSSLTRHHKRKHLKSSFKQPFACPECKRLKIGHYIISDAMAWSNHIETYHGKSHTPNLLQERQIWQTGAVPGSRERCMICNKNFQPGRAFTKHVNSHRLDGAFDQPFQCSKCPVGTLVDGLSAWLTHSAECHGGCLRTGSVPLAPEDVIASGSPSLCLICNRAFGYGRSFAKHLGTHKFADGTFDQPFQCSNCSSSIWIDGLAAWLKHASRCHGGCPRSGAVPLALEDRADQPTPSCTGLKREYDDNLDKPIASRSTKVRKLEQGPGRTQSLVADFIPIDPVLLNADRALRTDG
ncbi:hypothetical protein F5Y16DRAFT_30440 [Xylariaceae sp. FL0255]|nr:hypothetical protein F5Y16DRAFT_30440 [Xylariaceae sp. FL0255]